MNFDKIHWTESNIESISVEGAVIEVVASSIFFLGEVGTHRVRVVFSGVVSSRRTMTEYIGNLEKPDGFKTPYVLEDVKQNKRSNPTRKFGLEGVTYFEPIAWVEWELEAETGEVHVL